MRCGCSRRIAVPSSTASSTAVAASCRRGRPGSTTPPSRHWRFTFTVWVAGRNDRVLMDRNVTTVNAAPPSADGEGPLFAPGKRIYPQAVKGRYRNIKWVLLVVTLSIYYLLPFVR